MTASQSIIRLVTPALVPYDAIGNDVVQMARALTSAGYDARVLAGTVAPAYGSFARPLADVDGREWQSPDDVLIFHHSMGWPEGEELLGATANHVILRYHNITPPEYFAHYSSPHADACLRGLASAARLARAQFDRYWGDSAFNCAELIALGAPAERCRVLPPLHCVPELSACHFDYEILSRFRDGAANILFVGGFKPNKGHRRAMRVFAAYKERNPRARLLLVGVLSDGLQTYFQELEALARELGISADVRLSASVTDDQLRSYYAIADVFLCVSEHEGFCVPLVESMFFRVPIVAWATTAVPETLAGCGLVWHEYDETVLAQSIEECVERHELAAGLTMLGWRRYRSVYDPCVLRNRLIGLMRELTDAGQRNANSDARQ